MIRRHIRLLMMCLPTALFGQQQVPIFSSKGDSLLYHEASKALQQLFSHPLKAADNIASVDSLRGVQQEVIKRSKGFRYIYTRNREFVSFTTLDSLDPLQVKSLSIHDWPGKKLPASLTRCKHLKELEIVNSGIRKLPRSLRKLPELNTITLLNNRPTKGRIYFSKNISVKKLVIRTDNPQSLPKQYGNLKNLEELDLSRCNLSSFPPAHTSARLKRLILRENLLTLKDFQSKGLVFLEELNLQRNRIQKLPVSIGGLTSLKKLSCNYNEISELPSSIGNLSKLEEVSFYQNKLIGLPPEFYQLRKLKAVDLYYNLLEAIDEGVAQLAELEILYLSFNRLNRLPDGLGDLHKLQELYLHHNNLTYFPEHLQQLKGLKVLRINDNRFATFPYPIVSMQQLENLDVSGNGLQSLPDEIASLNKLKILSLGDNPWENREQLQGLVMKVEKNGTTVHIHRAEVAVK
jgi:Leucine-rich repeat (LRR) protein